MALNFAKFIQSNSILNDTEFEECLNDFCAQSGYLPEITDEEGNTIENPVTQTDYFNNKIEQYIIAIVDSRRYAKANESINYVKLKLS